MKKPRMQVVNRGKEIGIKVRWLNEGEFVEGRQKFSHPDCEIWIKGRDNDVVGSCIMNALQGNDMSSLALRRVKKERRGHGKLI